MRVHSFGIAGIVLVIFLLCFTISATSAEGGEFSVITAESISGDAGNMNAVSLPQQTEQTGCQSFLI